jgi:hypothetical protein
MCAENGTSEDVAGYCGKLHDEELDDHHCLTYTI